MADDIVAWLNRCIDEDERVALSAGADRWDHDVPRMVHHAPQQSRDKSRYVAGAEHDQIADHIARYDPSRVLREVAAKRALLNAAENVWTSHDIVGTVHLQQAVARLLAQPYAGEPGWDPSWTVD